MMGSIDVTPSFMIKNSANGGPTYAHRMCKLVSAVALLTQMKNKANFVVVQLCAWMTNSNQKRRL
jgi:amino acid permease